MKYLLGGEGLKVLESFCFTNTLFAFDFDGTLAPIVAKPSRARVSQKNATLLSQLNDLVPLAIISGRSVRDLKKIVPIETPFLVGNHGLEGIRKQKRLLSAAQETSMKWKKAIQGAIRGVPGIEIEDKSYSLAVHYRKARSKALARLRILDACADLEVPPRIIMGKCVVNLVPVGAPHKGFALLQLMLHTGVKSAVYVGDDDTDEDVFLLPNAHLLSVRVGKKVNTAARFFIKSQGEIGSVLSYMIRYAQK